jgi:hypothetical protein
MRSALIIEFVPKLKELVLVLVLKSPNMQVSLALRPGFSMKPWYLDWHREVEQQQRQQ